MRSPTLMARLSAWDVAAALTGVGLAAGALYAGQQPELPGVARELSQPLSALGHGCFLFLVLSLARDRLALRRRRAELTAEGPLPEWAGAGLRQCQERLGNRFTFKLAEQVFREAAEWNLGELEHRWLRRLALAVVPGLAGVLASRWLLRSPPVPYPAMYVGLTPTWVGLLETALVIALLLWNRAAGQRLHTAWRREVTQREQVRREQARAQPAVVPPTANAARVDAEPVLASAAEAPPPAGIVRRRPDR